MASNRKEKLGRRDALARLGLSVAVAYSAPTVLHLDRQARAVQPSCTGKGKGKGNPWCKGKGHREDKSARALEDWKRNNGNRYAYGRSDDRDGRDWDRDDDDDRDSGRRRKNDTYREKGRSRDRDDRRSRTIRSGFGGGGRESSGRSGRSSENGTRNERQGRGSNRGR